MKKEVLIVDDEIDICILLKSLLELKGIKSSYVLTLNEAEIKIEELKPSVLFLDMNLPDGNSIQKIEAFKNKSPNTTTIIMMSAYDTPEDREKALNKGVDTFLSKPFTRKQVLQILDHLVSS